MRQSTPPPNEYRRCPAIKKLLSVLLSLLLALSLAAPALALDLYVDTKKIETDVPPVVVDNRTLVPLRAIFEALNATLDWDGETQTVTASRGDIQISLQIGSTTAIVNGEEMTLDVAAQGIQGRTMVPARFVSEALNCSVTWDGNTLTVAVADELNGQQIYVTPTGKKYHFSDSCNGGHYYEATLAEAMGHGLTPCEKCVLKNP